MSGSDDMNNLDRGAAGGKSSKDSKKNLQGLLRRRYQQSRGSFRSDSNDENPSPVPEPVSFRPPARQSGKSSAPPSGARGGMDDEKRDANGNIIFENNFDLPPQNEDRSKSHKGHGQGQFKAQGQMTSHGKSERKPEKKGQLDSALSTVINEISSDSGRGTRSKQSNGGTVFENNFDDLDLDPSAGASGRGQPFTSRGRITPGASNSGDAQAETERQQRLEKLRRPREIKDNKDDKIFKMLQTSGQQDGVGNEKMVGSDQAAGGAQGRAMTEEEENEQFLSQALFAPAKKKKGNSKAAQQYNELMQRRLVGGRENADKAKKPERKLLDEDDKGGAKDPLTEMMNALSSLGGEGGGYQNGGGNQNRPDPMAQLLQNLGDMKAEKNDNQQPGQGGADPFAQLLGGLGGGMGNGGGEMMQQERQRNGDPMAQMMAMMGGGRGQRNGGGGGGGGLGQMLGGEGNGGGGGLGQLLGGLGGMGGQQVEGDEMAQIAAMMGGGRGRGQGQGGGLGQMLGGVGGGQQEGGDEMAQIAAMMGGGRGRGQGQGGGLGQMLGGVGGGQQEGGDEMAQLAAIMGGGRGQGQGGGLGQMLGGVGGGQQEGGDEMAQLAAIMGGGRGRGQQNASGGGIAQMLGGLGGMGGGENGGDEMAQLAAMMGAGGGQGMDPMSQMMAAFGGGGRGRGAAGDPMSQMMAMFGGGQMPGQGHGRGQGGQGEEEDINIENASLNDQIQQLLGYESLKARNNKSPKSDGMCTVIIIDTSGSMHGAPMTSVGDFISQFLNGLEEVQFEYALEENVAIVSVGREVHVVQHLTTDYGEVRRAVDTIYADGPSPLHLGLMIPLSILQLDLQQRRDYIANSNGHRICPRVIFITDGHPSTQEDTPGRSAPANEQESLTLQGICVELFQTVRDRTLCELYAVPVGDANQAFLQNLSESTGGGIRVPGEAKQMSRAYLHHHIVGNLKCSGHDITNRDVVAQVVQQIMACSDESDVDSVMKLIAQGEPDTQKRDQELQAQLQQAGRGRGGGGGGGGEGMAGGYQQMMQALLGGEMGGGRGGGRGEGMIRPVGGRGRAPLMGESRGMEAMMQSMRGRVPGVGGVAHRQQGAPNLFDDGLGGRVPGFGDGAQNRPSAPDIDLSAFGANGGVSDEEFGARLTAKIEHARKGGKPKPEWQVIGGLGRGEELKGGEEPIRLFGEDQQGQEDKQAKNGAAEAKQEKKKEDANADENPPANENAGNRVLTEEEIMRLMPQGGDNESVLGLSDSDNPAMTPEFVELLMTENDLEKRGFLSTLRNGRKARTEEEKRKRSLEKVMCAEKVGVNEPNSSDEDEEMGEPEHVPKRPEYTAQRDINSKLREALRKRDEKKQRAKAENRENEARQLGNQNDGNHLAQLFGGLNGQEADEVRHNVGRPYEPEPGLGRRVGGHGLPRGIPDLGFRRGRGGFPADYPGMGGNPEDRPPSSPPKHNLPDDIAALMQLDKKAERSKSGKPHGAQPGLVYKNKQGQAGASGSSQPVGRSARPAQTTQHGLEGLGLITDEDTDGDIEMGTASPRDTPHVEIDRSRSGQAAAASARRPAQNRGLEGLGLITDMDGDIEMISASPRDTPHAEVGHTAGASRRRPAQNRELRELLQQRQQRNARQSRTSSGRPTPRHTDTESDN